MSLPPDEVLMLGRAERQFWDAFERLKEGRPQCLPKGARVSQNNVAKEAGTVASALRRSRYPKLCEEIRRWIDHTVSTHDAKAKGPGRLAGRQHTRELRARIKGLEAQRDQALGKLVLVEAELVNLTIEN